MTDSNNNSFQFAKKLVLRYFQELEQAQESQSSIKKVIEKYTGGVENTWFDFKTVYPFRENLKVRALTNTDVDANVNANLNVYAQFWADLNHSFKHLQRRQDVFIAGINEVKTSKNHADEHWVMSMGHYMGLFDAPFINIRPTGKLSMIRYTEFHCVNLKTQKITQSAIFIDVIGILYQVGLNPLPPEMGQYFVYPGPKNHDGLLFNDAPLAQGIATSELLNQMVADLTALNESGAMDCSQEILEKTWSKNMVWYGPAGIGATYSISRYQKQHQLPFRNNLKDKKFNGHVCRFSEGNFACFFGWPNLSNTPMGGFLGLPGGEIRADMQVVDVYYREGDKLTENWVLLDIPFWLKQQGVDILERTTGIANPCFD